MSYNYSKLIGYHLDVNDVFFGKIETEEQAVIKVNQILKKIKDYPYRIRLCRNKRTFTSRPYGIGMNLHVFLTDKTRPQYKHDCPHCIFLGGFESEGRSFDLYYHDTDSNRTVLGRYGDEGQDYGSGIEFATKNGVPYLYEAKIRMDVVEYLKTTRGEDWVSIATHCGIEVGSMAKRLERMEEYGVIEGIDVLNGLREYKLISI